MDETRLERPDYEGELRELLRDYRRVCARFPAARRNARWLGLSLLAACVIGLGIVLLPFFAAPSGWSGADWALNLLLAGLMLLSTALQLRNLLCEPGGQSRRELFALFDSLRENQERVPEDASALEEAVSEDVFDCVIRLEMLDRTWEALPGIGFVGGALGGISLLAVLTPWAFGACRWGALDWLLNLVLLAAAVSLLVFELAMTAISIRARQEETALHNCFRALREDLRELGEPSN